MFRFLFGKIRDGKNADENRFERVPGKARRPCCNPTLYVNSEHNEHDEQNPAQLPPLRGTPQHTAMRQFQHEHNLTGIRRAEEQRQHRNESSPARPSQPPKQLFRQYSGLPQNLLALTPTPPC